MSSSFIVMFKQNTPKEEIEKAKQQVIEQGGTIGHTYDSVILGFSASIPSSFINILKENPHVEIIEQDQEVHTC